MRLTKKRADELLVKIARYEERKAGDFTDAFYLCDLHVFETLIKDATMTPEEEEARHTEKEKKEEEERNQVPHVNTLVSLLDAGIKEKDQSPRTRSVNPEYPIF